MKAFTGFVKEASKKRKFIKSVELFKTASFLFLAVLQAFLFSDGL